MAGSRLEKLGTVFTRVRDLLRAGVLKPHEKPVWYDVYAAFPPKREPLYEIPCRRRLNPPDNIPAILYKEDVIRAKFYEAYGNGPRTLDLSRTNFKSTCQRFVEKFTELEKQGEVDEEKLFEETGKALLAEGIILRRKGSFATRPQPAVAPEVRDPLLEMNLQSMLEEMQQEQKSKSSDTETQSTS